MTFIHGYLLAGLALVSVPVLLHLIMRQKPKKLSFPAFRFLRQRHLINRRKLRLQNWLLLLLRMGVIAALCLALARPRVAAERVAALFSGERPIAAVILFDTSASMEYGSSDRARLEEAKQRAAELLDEMDPNSPVALLDSGDDAGEGGTEWIAPALGRTRIDALRIRPANAALNRQMDRAARLLEKVGEGEDPPPRFLYLFSDRTRACWDVQAGPRKIPEGVRVLFVDVGTDKPKDLAIEKVEIVPPIVAPGDRVRVHVTLRATGDDFNTELLCQWDNDPNPERPQDSQAIQLNAGQGRVFVFEREAPARPRGAPSETTYQVTVKHQTPDALPFNNTAYATFLTRERRGVLTLTGDKPQAGTLEPWRAWETAMEVGELFRCVTHPIAQADKIDFKDFAVVCLFQVEPTADLWEKLAVYVRNGGGLVLIPGGEEMLRGLAAYNDEGTKVGLLPGAFEKIEKNDPKSPPILWSPFQTKHPISAYFHNVILNANPDFGKAATRPFVNAFWIVSPSEKDTVVLATYADPARHPALLDRAVGRGHVVQFTTPMDTRDLARNQRWHNYWSETSFGLVLVDQVCRYLAGDSIEPELNFFCGQTPRVPFRWSAGNPPFSLDGPGLAVAETSVKANENDTSLLLPQALTAGNYAVRDANKRIVAGCSLNVRPQESDLGRVPVGDIESVLGKESLLQVGRTVSMKDALLGMRPPPLELLPWLMITVLIVLTIESLLASRFYRRAAPELETAGGQTPA